MKDGKLKKILIWVVVILLCVSVVYSIVRARQKNPMRYTKVDITFNEDTTSDSADYNESVSVIDYTEVESSVTVEESSVEESSVIETYVEPVTVIEVNESDSSVVVNNEQEVVDLLVGEMNIVDVINLVIKDSPDLSYCSSEFSYDRSILNDYEVLAFYGVDIQYAEGIVNGYILTPEDEVNCTFSFTLNSGKLSYLEVSIGD